MDEQDMPGPNIAGVGNAVLGSHYMRAGEAFWANILGAGHNRVTNLQDLSGGSSPESAPPRARGSANNGHGARTLQVNWPLGDNWSLMTGAGDDTLGKFEYIWSCGVVGYGHPDFPFTFGPVSLGLRSSASSLDVNSNITGYELFASGGATPALRVYVLRYRLTPGAGLTISPWQPLPSTGTSNALRRITWIYRPGFSPEIEVRISPGGFSHVFKGQAFMPQGASLPTRWGPAVEGKIITTDNRVLIRQTRSPVGNY